MNSAVLVIIFAMFPIVIAASNFLRVANEYRYWSNPKGLLEQMFISRCTVKGGHADRDINAHNDVADVTVSNKIRHNIHYANLRSYLMFRVISFLKQVLSHYSECDFFLPRRLVTSICHAKHVIAMLRYLVDHLAQMRT